MAKSFKCSDAGMDCGFEAKGESEQELMGQVAQHAKEAHGIEQVSPELAATVRGKIKDV